ncbi:F-box/kelch-repeat protein At3g24760 [Cajanus cajan]|uniref:F-box/kelch-repeat protein At3g24760 family n=1 Tax=Cajanus cajan TaxID=3821 RepID=A0A151RES3_CAJCA|nr:F-box/kelch-repeat protein At3g24760 [Cajanus cajan]KYP41128.1 F-box/kelch-repeat protein At3g24760 family [Cajanus cajan]
MMTEITNLSSDLLELILSLLPIPTLIRVSTVCKLWHSIISSSSFSTLSHNPNQPWFFLHGIHNISSKNNQSFAFDPSSNTWFLLPTPHQPNNTSFIGSNSFLFITAPKFLYTPILHPSWHATPPLNFPRTNPLLASFHTPSNKNHNFTLPHFIVVGGVRFIGNLVDIEDRLDVEIYDPLLGSWALAPPLPPDFRSGNSSSSLSSALFRGKFYVFGIYSCFVSSFDLHLRVWSEVHTLRPHGVVFSFLVACRNHLVLAGVCNFPHGSSSFALWKVDEGTMGVTQIAVMPHDLLCSMFDGDEDDKFASLKCVGMGDLVYVFNEDYHMMYPACVCEIDGESGRCVWRRVPPLPSLMNRFHKVISFCSTVSLHNILGERQQPALQY